MKKNHAGKVVSLVTAAVLVTGTSGCSQETPESSGYAKPPASATSFDIRFANSNGDAVDYANLPDVDVMELDGADTPAETVAELEKRGIYTLCYLNAGAWEDWRADKNAFPESALGKDYNGWEGEKWLDIRNEDIRPIIKARLAECAEKGFKAVDPDNLDGYQVESGFPLTEADQIAYLTWLSETAHELGLAIVLKNAPDLAAKVVGKFDGAVVESCHEYDECGKFASFVKAGKPVFLIGYPASDEVEDTELPENEAELATICDAAQANGFAAAVRKARALTEQSQYCSR